MGYLKDKLVKKKRLQKLSTSYVVIIPNNWIEEMNWTREIMLDVIWRPDTEEIIVRKNLDVVNVENVEDEKISELNS